MHTRFRDRFHAGQLLAMELATYADRPDVLILAIPRDGVPVGFELARALQAPLDVFVVTEIYSGTEQPVRLGAIASGGVVLLDCEAGTAGVEGGVLDESIARGREELDRRERLYRGDRPRHEIGARTVVLVDDDLSEPSQLRDAIAAVRHHGPLRIVVAVPAACAARREQLRGLVDDLVCLTTALPEEASFYTDTSPVADDQVRELLELADEITMVA